MDKTNLNLLYTLLEKIKDQPYFVLPKVESAEWLWELNGLIKNLTQALSAHTAPELDYLNQIINAHHLNEYRLSVGWGEFLQKYSPLALDRFSPLFQAIMSRSKNFWLFEEQALQKRLTNSHEEIFSHDQQLLQNEMQIYCLDYFLAIQKTFKNGDTTKRLELIIQGQDSLPSLKEDAISNDMLDKLVYQTWNWFLKVTMTREYYIYRQALMGINVSSSHEQIQNVGENLTQYCLSLLSILEEYNIHTIKPGIMAPYGTATVVEVRKQLV